MSGCANCVWLDYAEEMVKYYEALGKKMELSELLNTLDDNVDDKDQHVEDDISWRY